MNKEEWLRTNFIVCPKCGYNNEKKRNVLYGKCLRCGEVLDKKTYLRYLLYKSNSLSDKKKGAIYTMYNWGGKYGEGRKNKKH